MRLADLTGRAAAMTIWSGWAGSCYALLIWLVWKLLCLAGLAGREGVVHLGQKLSGIGGARSAQQDLNVIKLLSNDGDPNPIGTGLFCRLRKFYHKIQFRRRENWCLMNKSSCNHPRHKKYTFLWCTGMFVKYLKGLGDRIRIRLIRPGSGETPVNILDF